MEKVGMGLLRVERCIAKISVLLVLWRLPPITSRLYASRLGGRDGGVRSVGGGLLYLQNPRSREVRRGGRTSMLCTYFGPSLHIRSAWLSNRLFTREERTNLVHCPFHPNLITKSLSPTPCVFDLWLLSTHPPSIIIILNPYFFLECLL